MRSKNVTEDCPEGIGNQGRVSGNAYSPDTQVKRKMCKSERQHRPNTGSRELKLRIKMILDKKKKKKHE